MVPCLQMLSIEKVASMQIVSNGNQNQKTLNWLTTIQSSRETLIISSASLWLLTRSEESLECVSAVLHVECSAARLQLE